MPFTKKAFLAGAIAGVGVAAAAGAGAGMALSPALAAGQNVSREVQATTHAAPPGAPGSFADIFEKVAPAVVSINVTSRLTGAEAAEASGLPFPFNQMPQFQNPGRGGRGGGGTAPNRRGQPKPDGDDDNDDNAAPEAQASGSGFFISADGYIVTNNHVIDKATSITVVLNDKRELKARLIGKDEDADLAVIKVEGGSYPFAQFETQTKPRVGDWVLAVGNPFLLGGTATAGIVSALARDLPPDSAGSFPVDYIQIDAPINRGNSGGPTFDIYGRVIGVNTAIYSSSGGSVGIGFAVPADTADGIVKQLIAGKKITRGYLGATIQNLAPDAAEALGIPANSGAQVADITAGGPGAKGGLQAGDIVTSLNGKPVTSSNSLTRAVAGTPAGGTMRLEVRRGGKMQTVTVIAGLRPSASALNALDKGPTGAGDEDKPPSKPGALLPSAIGMTYAPLDAAARSKYSIAPDVHGVVIDTVSPSSDAGHKGVHPGDVIVQLNQRPVASAQEVLAGIGEAKSAGRTAVYMLISRAGRNVGLAIKLEAPRKPSTPPDAG